MRGHIRRRGKRSWQLILPASRDPATGKRRQQSRNVRGTKKDAQVALVRWIHEIETGLDFRHSPTHRCRVSEPVARFQITQDARRTAKRRTYANYEEKLRLHVITVIGNVPLAKLRPQHVEQVHAAAFEKGLSARSVLHVHRILFQAIRQAVRWQLIANNVAEAVELPSPKTRELPPPPASEAGRLIALFEHTDLLDVVVFAIGSGLRLGEIFGLRWQDLDLSTGRVSVVQTLHVDGTLRTPKTHTSRASVFLPQFAMEALKRQRAAQNKRRLKFAREWQDLDLVFDRGDGGSTDTRSISRRFSAMARKGGFDLTFHGLRHAHASLMHGSGTDLKTISENMRHSTIAITADLYTHIDPGDSQTGRRETECVYVPLHDQVGHQMERQFSIPTFLNAGAG
jgi:integrase